MVMMTMPKTATNDIADAHGRADEIQKYCSEHNAYSP